jgi:hypothetical protein
LLIYGKLCPYTVQDFQKLRAVLFLRPPAGDQLIREGLGWLPEEVGDLAGIRISRKFPAEAFITMAEV